MYDIYPPQSDQWSHQPAPPPEPRKFSKCLLWLAGAVATAVITAIITLAVNVGGAQVQAGGNVSRFQAQKFLEHYYASVVKPSSARIAFETMLAPEAQIGLAGGWANFQKFWKQWSEVRFDTIQPTAEKNTFEAEMTYVDLHGRQQSWRKEVWKFECNSSAKYFSSCPSTNILLKDTYVERS